MRRYGSRVKRLAICLLMSDLITTAQVEDHERFRAELSSIAGDGRRKWIYARQQKGRFYTLRTYVSTVLLFFFMLAPMVKVNGHQFMLLNLMDRRFVLFGVPFWPQDLWLLVVLLLLCVVSVILITATAGRVWCGWLCPQTVFMEMVFRRFEWFVEGGPKEQARRHVGPWSFDRIWRSVVKQFVFLTISFLIANVFLAYLIGSDTLLLYVQAGPFSHLNVFVPLLLFSVVFYAVFARFREQACVIVCPYGRYMSALVDESTIAVTYDFVRGEPRKKGRDRQDAGACVDCYQCVTVCPTGIDIRNGIQLECVNCTACIDACDDVMEKTEQPKGLLRYSSATAIKNGKSQLITPRILAYTAVWLLLLVFTIVLFASRKDVEITLLRQEGITWVDTPDGPGNFYRIEIINRSAQERSLVYSVLSPPGAVMKTLISEEPISGWSERSGRLLVVVPRGQHERVDRVEVQISDDTGVLHRETTRFLSPNGGKWK